ncbi:MAG: flagellin [Myxococcales bacterium]|nr:flagellin [Myxococcales bacterium]
MGMFVNTNVRSLNTQRSLNYSTKALDRSFQRLASGKRINSAKDDAAGLSISTRFTAQIRGLNTAVRNTNDGISLVQTVEGALQESMALLQRMRELSVQAANDINTTQDRQSINFEIQSLILELDRIADNTLFNDKKVLSGDFMQGYFHVGAKADDVVEVNVRDAHAKALGRSAIKQTAVVSTNALSKNGGDILINSITVRTTSAADDQLSTSFAAGSALAKAAAINDATNYTGVSARVLATEARTDLDIAGGSLTNTSFIEINGVTLTTFDVATDDADHELKNQINAVADRTGVLASYDENSRLILTAGDGRNIEVNVSDAAATAVTGLTSGVSTGSLEFSSGEQFRVSGGQVDYLGLTGEQIVGVDSLASISTVNVLDRAGANNAITIVDRALEQLSKDRSDYGALLNRLESTANNLANISENASQARSRIVDADFAVESAMLARGQVLQQAGVSILAQANQSPQLATQLLG